MSQTSDIIRLLPDSVANQIAAGEVIQRPASVIKELVENAVDAGATKIQIVLLDAGRTLIQVIDNGSGMSETDARLAFERHATSKITAAADLFSLHTMGFRGEALASIAAVAQVDMRTMLKDSSLGTRIIINGSVVESQEPEACAPGTNIMVKNLFFNVPARRKFLKKDSVEFSNILREFERLALVNPDVELSIIHNDMLLHQLSKAPVKRRIADLFGKTIEQKLIPIETDTSIVRISGFIGLPESARKRNALQYLFVNGRNMRHPGFHKAIMSCYEGIIANDQQPNYFVNFDVDPQTIDVNIHPTKSEIKFENEGAIWQMLVAAVRESLGRFNASGAIDFDLTDAPEIPAFNPDSTGEHNIELDPTYNPFDSAPAELPTDSIITPPVSFPDMTGNSAGRQQASYAASSSGRVSSINTRNWEKLYEDFASRRDAPDNGLIDSSIRIADQPELPAMSAQPLATSGRYIQFNQRYIVSAAKSGLMVVDQNRAHMRILYDRYISSDMAVSSQKVLFPEVMELSPALNVTLTEIADDLQRSGFDISFLGGCSWSINGIPADLDSLNTRETLMNIIADVAELGRDSHEPIEKRIALSMARAAALKHGTTLNQTEMTALMGDLLKLSSPDYTPDGKLIISIIPTDDVVKLF